MSAQTVTSFPISAFDALWIRMSYTPLAIPGPLNHHQKPKLLRFIKKKKKKKMLMMMMILWKMMPPPQHQHHMIRILQSSTDTKSLAVGEAVG